MPSRFQLRGSSLEGIEWKLFNSHGTAYRIVAAEKVTEGGLAGFFAKHFFEVTVEIPDPPGPSGPGAGRPGVLRPERAAPTGQGTGKGRHTAPGVAGIEALLRLADGADGGGSAAAAPQVSTGSAVFAELLDNLDLSVEPGVAGLPFAAPPAGVPEVAYGSGQLVLVVGLGEDAIRTARSMTAALGPAELRTAGSIRAAGVAHVSGRNGITQATAAAAKAGRAVVVAFGAGTDGAIQPSALTDFDPDQVWVAVDATRKPADTAVWVRRVSWALRTDALAVLGSTDTLTPGTVNDLGIPLGWVDGKPATAAIL